RDRLAIDRDNLSAIFRCQYSVAIAANVDTRMHSLFFRVRRILPHTERRGNEKKLFPFHRERIACRLFSLPKRIVFHPEFLPLFFHLFHYLTVVCLQPVPL